MSGYVFKQLEIENFKYIPADHPVSVSFQNSDIVILGGQNGYGKTTLFDAIELLLTGSIKHFNSDLLNRGSESIGILAYNPAKDIIIKGWFSFANVSNVTVIRIFRSSNDFLSDILWNDTEITQEELYARLKTSLSMFDIGTYISQSQSLSFLQNKYKNRKEQVSTLLANSQIIQKIQLLQEIQQKIKTRTDEQLNALEVQEEALANRATQLEEQSKSISSTTTLPDKNIRLFPDKDYSFDRDDLIFDTTYAAFIQPLEQIELFVKNYDEYIKYIHNYHVTNALGISSQVFMALFYSKQIVVLKDNQLLLNTISKCKTLLGQFQQHRWSLDVETFLAIGLSQDTTDMLKSLLDSKQIAQKSLNETDKALVELSSVRATLIRQFEIVTTQGSLENNICPLCGTKLEDIQKAFVDTEKSISNIHEDGVNRIDQLEHQIVEISTKKIVPQLERVLTQNNQLIKINDALNTCKNLSTDKLSELLEKLGITEFCSIQPASFSLDEFTLAYEKLKLLLQERKKPNAIIISDEELELYKSINYNYYGNTPPIHTLEQLKTKRQYLANRFLNNLNQKLTEAKAQLEKAKKERNNYITKNELLQEAIKTLVKKNEDANKDYQSLLANAIKLPLLIYSGKIIQNYPMGLGVKAIIKTNQLVFESASKEGVDVYNILSTGQLNGLAIAILLSVRNVYVHPDGLDILLIDDPLQTIDDISAISLADLLAQQHIGQIILSTHEDQKARLLKFKFEQDHLIVCEKNMQKIYIETKQ